MKNRLYKIIIFLICAEFIFTSLGFCGHDHHHAQNKSFPALQQQQIEQPDSKYPHSHPQSNQENKSDTRGKYHCSCLGSFLSAGILQIHYINLPFTDLVCEKIVTNTYLSIKPLFHPPRELI